MGEYFPVNPALPALKELGQEQPPFRTQKILLDDAFELKEYEFAGTSFWVYDSSSLEATARVRFQEQRSDPIPAREGLWLRGMPFSRMYIDNLTAQAGEWIEFAVVNEQKLKQFGLDTFEIQNSLQGFNKIRFDRSRNLVTKTPVTVASTATKIADANTSRRELVIYNDSNDANTYQIHVGDSSVTSANGIPLSRGNTMFLESSDEVWAISQAGNTTVRVMEISD